MGVDCSVRSVLQAFFSLFHRDNNGIEQNEAVVHVQESRFPVKELSKLVGRQLEVDYVNVGVSLPTWREYLIYEPDQEFFYIGNKDGSGYHIIYWDRTDSQGRRSAVRSIRCDGQMIYDASATVTYNASQAAEVLAERERKINAMGRQEGNELLEQAVLQPT